MMAPERTLYCAAAILTTSAACGRIGFEPPREGASDALNGDSSALGDGATAVDTPVSACAAAITVSAQHSMAAVPPRPAR